MIALIVRRLLWMVPAVWAAATLVWIFMFLIPGDPARILAGQRADEEVLERVRAEWGLDRPPAVRYGLFLWKLVHLDFGTSYVYRVPVSEMIFRGLFHTFFLAVAATALALLVGLSLGMLSAARGGTWIDGAALALSTASISLPTFWVGMMLILVFSSWLGWLPVSGYGDGPGIGSLRLPGLAHLVLPSITLAFSSSGFLARVTRASLLEESTQEYVRAARARGLSAPAALARHVLPNSLLPIVTMAGMNFGSLLGGAIVTEIVFNWPGVGTVIYHALHSRDLPVVEGGAIAMTAIFLLVNLAVDISYTVLDPRIRR
ncbi:MAG TPA: ABC transporter permease [Candidatus Polarisedimenticolia bacterium]|jgi:ABC-type dipeptide/oligopeptide/nickel transport system permease component